MVPETDQFYWQLSQLLVCADNALENFGNVSQVKGVVRFAGRRLHGSVEDLVVNLELGFDEWRDAASYVRVEVGEECVHDCSEDHTDGRERHVGVSDDIEETLQPLCDNSSATAGWAHSRAHHKVNNSEPRLFLVFAVVPASESHKLSNKFDWWLSSILFFLWHVEVVDEDDVLLTESGTIAIFSSLFEVGLKIVLRLISRCLG